MVGNSSVIILNDEAGTRIELSETEQDTLEYDSGFVLYAQDDSDMYSIIPTTSIHRMFIKKVKKGDA